MGAPKSLLGEARAFARDFPRDRMPKGYLWDVLDFVPAVIDAPLTGRGAWKWGSNNNIVIVGDFKTGLLMPFKEGDQLLAATDTNLYQVSQNAPYDVTVRGATFPSLQNPVRYRNQVVHFSHDGSQPMQLWNQAGIPVSVHADHKHAKFGTTFRAMLVSAGAPGEENIVRFSKPPPNDDLTLAGSYDPNSFLATAVPITAIAGMRSVILVFHAGSVERIRGSIPPHGIDEVDDDMFVEDLFDNVGCVYPKSIAYWNDNVVFADEHGVHITDGAVVRNLASQGGISYYWRMLYEANFSVVGTVFLDYYIVTLRHDPERPPPPILHEDEQLPEITLEEIVPLADPPRPPIPPIPPDLPPVRPPVPEPDDAYNTTLICDLNRRQWFRFSNIDARVLFSGSSTGGGMERVWAGIGNRLARIGPCFYPNFGAVQIDDNGALVTPRLQTPWYRLSEEGRKRVRFVYVSYDVRGEGANANPLQVGYILSPEVTDYYQAGLLPSTNGYKRFRLPVYKFPYGIAFYLQAQGSTFAVRVYDIAAEAQPAERSRV